MFREEVDILVRLVDLHKQATTENSHYYVADCLTAAICEITKLRLNLAEASQQADSADNKTGLVCACCDKFFDECTCTDYDKARCR